MSDYYEKSVEMHRRLRGKLEVRSKVAIDTHEAMSLAYTPGVGRPCELIAENPSQVDSLTIKGNSVAVVTDGSSVLGLGNIGPQAALPVMEGKALLFKVYADIDAWPICLDTQEVDEIVATVRHIAPTFGGINLEDIAAPRCFQVEKRLQDLGIPVFHDDQHGTAAVVLAALHNACRVLGRDMGKLRVVIAGAGAAGIAITRLLLDQDGGGAQRLVEDLILCDSRGIIHSGRGDLTEVKRSLLSITNRTGKAGSLQDALVGADLFIGVSHGGLLSAEDVRTMAPDPLVFALANPEPEIWPAEAQEAGAALVATGRSDLPNQVNNVLIFPGIFRGALDARATRITPRMIRAAAIALADYLPNPSVQQVLPDPLDVNIGTAVGKAVADAW